MPLFARKKARRQRRLRTLVLWTAGSAIAFVLAALLGLAWYERGETLDAAQNRAEWIALLLDDQASRTVSTTGVALRTLGSHLGDADAAQLAHSDDLLRLALPGLASVRSLALVDADGHVLASTEARDRGLRLDLSLLGALPRPGKEALLPLKQGRSLVDLKHAGEAVAPVYSLPFWHRLAGARSELLLLALINPDALANYQQTALADGAFQALLLSARGRLISATEGIAEAPGQLPQRLQGLPQLQLQHDHGSYFGAGMLGAKSVVAWRSSRTQPLAIVVEQEQGTALRTWYQFLWTWGSVGLLVLLLIAASTAAVLRSLQGREQARAAADAAHEQVVLREREMSVVLKSVQELIFRAGVGGVLTFVNARWGVISQQRAELAMGRRLQDLVEPADRERAAALFNPEDRGSVRTAKVCIQAADGLRRQFEVAVVPLYSQGQLVGFAGSAVDVTEREVAQHELQRQLGFSSLLLELSPQPISLIDMQGCYLTVNRAWEDFMGQRREQVVGRLAGFFLPPEERLTHHLNGVDELAQGGQLRYEAKLRHRDGELRDMLVTKVLLRNEDGSMAGVLKTLMDVSEFREAERATREAMDAAEEASRAKSEFIANISHELRTPLQSILGFSELGAARGRDAPKLVAMFDSIHASGQRMLALVNDLLDVSKIESAVGTFHMERCDLRGQIRSVLREFEPLLQPRHLQLESRLAEQPLSAKVDPLRFQQVIRNVLANAVKFSPEGGRIELSAGLRDDGQILISIADRGPGVPPAELDAIFDAFVQSSKTKDGSGGTGLGLAICRKIVDLHGGSIVAANREGGGALFSIVLPARGSTETQFATSL